MQRTDYRRIARTLRDCKPSSRFAQPYHDAWHDICTTFAEDLATTNPRFDADRFLAACGVPTTTGAAR